jgi:4'-phosphopantetheinyl transferase
MSQRPLAGHSDVDANSQPARVRVWRTDLDRSESETAALAGLLSDDERARADRFRFDRDRQRFTVARGQLRRLLGSVLGVAGHEIEFSYAVRGKPGLKWPEGSELEFNLSHSNGLALIATCWRCPVGVDIEWQRPTLDFQGIADRFFTPREVGEIVAQPEDARRSAFFRGWTRKEAFIKARGDGLWLGLDQFEVSIDPAVPPRLVRTAWDPEEIRRWTLLDLDAPDGFSAALVVAGAIAGPVVVDVL